MPYLTGNPFVGSCVHLLQFIEISGSGTAGMGVLVQRKLSICYIDVEWFSHMQGGGWRRSGSYLIFIWFASFWDFAAFIILHWDIFLCGILWHYHKWFIIDYNCLAEDLYFRWCFAMIYIITNGQWYISWRIRLVLFNSKLYCWFHGRVQESKIIIKRC